MQVFAGATDLTDADIVLGEGRQIVFVEPARALTLDLSATATRVVPAFLDSDLYRRLQPLIAKFSLIPKHVVEPPDR